MSDYPRYVLGTGSLSVFKMFSPDLGYALTGGCSMEAGTIITSERGTRPLSSEVGSEYDVHGDITAERLQAELELGKRRVDIEGPTTGHYAF